MKGLLILALVLAGCQDVASTPTASTDPLGLHGASRAPATRKPLATGARASDPPDAAADLAVTVTKRTSSVARKGTASVTIATTPGAECGIDVEYASGSSTATGLEPKNADAKGTITWKWVVVGNTPKGKVPIAITCTLGDRFGTVNTELTVK